MLDILSMTPEEISGLIMGHPVYRAQQIFEHLHKRNTQAFAAMKNLPLSLRSFLEENCYISTVTTVEKHMSSDSTVKFLSATRDNNLIESVLMSYRHGHSVCISTQAGCRMGCKFCASGENGLARNLTAGEYCAQVYNVANETATGSRPRSIVLMGCGEPLDNYSPTLRFIELITHSRGMNIGQRHVTISTCGLVPEILKLAEEKLQTTLAISLHAPDDTTREALMPINKTYPLRELIPACRHYAEKTRRRLTFEYALAKGINSTPSHATALAKLLKGLLCHVNLIPVNKARGAFSPAPRSEILAFAAILQENNITSTIRRSLGDDVAAACGQLRFFSIPSACKKT